MNRAFKVECYITLGWKGLSGANTLAYWAHPKVTKKMECCEYSTRLQALPTKCQAWFNIFRIDVTFEMRTVLNGICLFIDNSKSSDNIFISNGDGGKRAG
jgi:hypothetical protein